MINVSTKKRDKSSSRAVVKRSHRPRSQVKVVLPSNMWMIVAIEGKNTFIIRDRGYRDADQSKCSLFCSCFAAGCWSEARYSEGYGRPLRGI